MIENNDKPKSVLIEINIPISTPKNISYHVEFQKFHVASISLEQPENSVLCRTLVMIFKCMIHLSLCYYGLI